MRSNTAITGSMWNRGYKQLMQRACMLNDLQVQIQYLDSSSEEVCENILFSWSTRRTSIVLLGGKVLLLGSSGRGWGRCLWLSCRVHGQFQRWVYISRFCTIFKYGLDATQYRCYWSCTRNRGHKHRSNGPYWGQLQQ